MIALSNSPSCSFCSPILLSKKTEDLPLSSYSFNKVFFLFSMARHRESPIRSSSPLRFFPRMSNLRRDQIVSKGLLLFLLSLDAALAFMATEFGAVLLFFFFFLDFVLLLLLLLLLFDVFAIAEFFFFFWCKRQR